MARSRSFSIYLFKEDFDSENSLTDDHRLDAADSPLLPDDASIFVLDNTPYPPWWKGYFEIQENLTQVTKGALVFLPVGDRCFALCFGHVSHYLKNESYEYDFGLRVTLNCVDPKELRSTDSLEPGMGRRQRTQLPIGSDLTFFDFDKDSSVLRRLTGKVKDEYRSLFKQATGASNLRVSSDLPANSLIELCEKLLELYKSEAYRETFPDIQNIAPVRDPVVIERLNELLVEGVRSKDDALALVVPDIINYEESLYASFSGGGPSLQYEDVFIGRYYEYLDSREIELAAINVSQLRAHRLVLEDENGEARSRHRIYDSLVFDVSFGGASYHLSDGGWYKVEDDYIKKLESYLDPLCIDPPLPPYAHKTEGEYNAAVPSSSPLLVCLDQTNISPDGETPIEPCDIYSVQDDFAVFYHVKVSTLSSMLSHLFNQGANPIELIRLDGQSLSKLKELVKERAPADRVDALLAPLDLEKHAVFFAIVTHKDKSKKSKNLPLFSRISLMRNLKAMQAGNVRGQFGFVDDQSKKAEPKKKARKKKNQ